MTLAISIAAIVAASTFTLFFALRRDSHAPPAALLTAVAAAALLELFDLLALSNPALVLQWKKCALAVEALLPAILLWFSLTYARQSETRTITLPFRLLLALSPFLAGYALILPVGSFFYSPDFAAEQVLFLGNAGLIFYLVVIVYLIVPLVNLEMTFVHTSLKARWRIKFELLGAGALILVMVVYYSQTLLFRTLNMQMLPLRSLVLIAGLAMMSYSRLKRGSGVTVYVDRQMIYKSVVLIALAFYLVVLGLAGEGMRYFGDSFQRAILFAVCFLGGLCLLVVLLSSTVQRRIKVFINKNFYKHKYDYRNQWLQFTDRLSASRTGEDLLRSIVIGFCDSFGMGCGGLFILSQESETYQLAVGVSMEPPAPPFAAGDPDIEAMSGSRWIIDLRDGTSGFSRYRPFIDAHAGAFLIPLFMHEGLDGFILIGRPMNRQESYTYEDFDLMRALGRQASLALLNLRLSDQLARSREMAAIGKVSTFVIHDLKNLASTVSLMLENAHEHIANPAFQQDLLTSLGATAAKMKAMITRLKHLPDKGPLQRTPVDLLQLAQETAALVRGTALQVTGTHVIAEVDREELQKVALNLILNAVEATEGQTPVTVEVGEADRPFLRVRDRGCGIPVEFLHRAMFVPFMSTKKKGLGIGLYQSKQIVEAHGGKIEVNSSLNQGSEFIVWLPKGA